MELLTRGVAEAVLAFMVFVGVVVLSIAATAVSFVRYRRVNHELSGFDANAIESRRRAYLWTKRIGWIVSLAALGRVVYLLFT